MILYLAGNPGHGKAGKIRTEFLNDNKIARGMSFFWCRTGASFNNYFLRTKEAKDEIMFRGRRDDREEPWIR